MIELLQTALTMTTIITMVVTLFVAFIPFVPGPFLLWCIALAYGLIESFTALSPIAFVIITVLMVIGSTVDVWAPLLGMRARGTTLGSIAAGIAGALLGTVFIPLPVLGTLAGAAVGAITVEYLNVGTGKRALRAGASAAESYLLSVFIEFAINLAILLTFILSIAFS